MKNILKKNQLMITALAIMIAVAGYLQFAGTKLDKEEYLPASGDGTTLDNAEVEDFTAGGVTEDYSLDELMNPTDGTLDSAQLTEIDSLDTDADVVADDYLAEGMDVAETEAASADSASVDGVNTEAQTPAEGEIPGEAVFTGTTAVSILSEAKLLKEQVRAKNKATLMEIIDSATLSDEQKQTAVDSMVLMTTIAEQEMGAEILLEAKGFSDVVVSVTGDSADVVVNATELTDAQRAQIEDIVKRKTNVKAENIIISTVVR